MNETIDWLLRDSDPALEYQVRRDLLSEPVSHLEKIRKRIPESGWVKSLLDRRKANGHWGEGAYNPKWTCTHYVLYELCQLEAPGDLETCRESARLLLSCPEGLDGGINYARTVEYSDVCVNGMLLTIAGHFGLERGEAEKLIDYLLRVGMADGGWNCEYLRGGTHSSLHTTIAVVEGLGTWLRAGKGYREDEILVALAGGVEFILRHSLYKSERTGETIRDEFFRFFFPVRWKYDILRCLDLFRKLGLPFDGRMGEALVKVAEAASKSGRWKASSQPGKTYFMTEKNGAEGRWNSLRALRVLERYSRSTP